MNKHFNPTPSLLLSLLKIHKGLEWDLKKPFLIELEGMGFSELKAEVLSPEEFTATMDQDGNQMAMVYFSKKNETIDQWALAWNLDKSVILDHISPLIKGTLDYFENNYGPPLGFFNQFSEWIQADFPDQAVIFSAFWPRIKTQNVSKTYSDFFSYQDDLNHNTDSFILNIIATKHESDNSPVWDIQICLQN